MGKLYLQDVKVEKDVVVSARIPEKYKDWIVKNNVSLKKLIIAAIEQIDANEPH